MKTRFISVVLTVALYPSLALACNSPSPFGHTPEQYFSGIKQKSITKKEYGEIQHLFDQIDGQWTGNGTYLECKRVDGVLQKVRDKLEIHIETDAASDFLQMRSKVDFAGTGRVKKRTDKTVSGKVLLTSWSEYQKLTCTAHKFHQKYTRVFSSG